MVLSVLKIIGIVILIIIAVFILILGIVLFVPFHYQFAVQKNEDLDADAEIRWTPVLLKVIVNYKDGNLEYVIRLLGGVIKTNKDIPLSWIGRRFFSGEDDGESEKKSRKTDKEYLNESQDKKRQSRQKKDKNQYKEKVQDETDVIKKEEMEAKESDAEKQEGKDRDIAQNQVRNSIQENGCKKEESKRYVSDNLQTEIHDNGKKREKRITVFDKIQKKINYARNRIKQWVNKLKKLNEKKEALLKVYNSKRFELAKRDIIKYINELFRIIKPKKAEGYVHFGLEEPSNTGQVLGIMAMFFPLYDSFLKIQPDFEQSCLDGKISGKGRVYLFSVIKWIIKIYMNKNLIKVIKKVQTIIEA